MRPQVEYQGQTLDFERPFRRASMHELVHEVTGGTCPPAHVLMVASSF